MSTTYMVKVAPGIRHECIDDRDHEYHKGDYVVLQYAKYQDAGTITYMKEEEEEAGGQNADQTKKSKGQNKRDKKKSRKLPRILRHANLEEKGAIHENETRARNFFRTAQQRIRYYNLSMKLLTCHMTMDRKLVIFIFSAEERIDFRELVKDLSQSLNIRVEMRQVGVRDEAAILGGLGVCGRPLCCASVLEEFESVNVKTAKTQRLSLSPTTVSGVCGRLKCCLRYEAEGYKELTKTLPKDGAYCETPKGRGYVLDCNPLTQNVRLRLEEDQAQIVQYKAEEVTRVQQKQKQEHKKQEKQSAETSSEASEKKEKSQSQKGDKVDPSAS